MSAAPRIDGAKSPKPAFKHPAAAARMKALNAAAREDELGKDARSILLHASLYMDLDGWCYPSATRLAEDTGYTERAVRGALNQLRGAGIVLSLEVKRWKIALGDRPKVPKHLPMLLLWPAATPSAKLLGLGVAGSEPKKLTGGRAFDDSDLWYIMTTEGGEKQGPYKTSDVERWARTEKLATTWKMQKSDEPGSTPSLISNWYWFGSYFPRVPRTFRL